MKKHNYFYMLTILFLLTACPVHAAESAKDHNNDKNIILPDETLFDPLMADPRWPHFSVAYQSYIGNDELKNVGATSFGETFPLFSGNAFGGRWITGIQAAVFAFFNLDADSMDLINADYWVGIPVAYRKENFSGLFRIFHQSSHLGDEYLLYNKIDRVNLSYEGIDVKFSYDIDKLFRVYAGTGYIIHKEPSGIDPLSAQFGMEYRSPGTFLSNRVRPIAAVDMKTWEENDWDADISARLGLQLENVESKNRKVQLMLEYFSGHSPHGQFYNRTIEYAGFGIHFYF